MNPRSRNWLIAFAIVATVLLWVVLRPTPASALQALAVPSADDVRFQLMGNEPIAAPDGRALVTGWSVLMFRDKSTGRCYVALKHGDAIALDSAECGKTTK